MIDVTGREIVVERLLNALPAAVFRAWTTPDEIVKWWGPNGFTTTILEMYVDDVDAVYQRAVDAGAKAVMPVGDAFYGDRMGWVADPFGHLWAISTVKEELTPEQVHDRMTAAFKRS